MVAMLAASMSTVRPRHPAACLKGTDHMQRARRVKNVDFRLMCDIFSLKRIIAPKSDAIRGIHCSISCLNTYDSVAPLTV